MQWFGTVVREGEGVRRESGKTPAAMAAGVDGPTAVLVSLYERVANTVANEVPETVFSDNEIATIRSYAPALVKRRAGEKRQQPIRPGHAKKLLKVAASVYDCSGSDKRQRLDEATPLTALPPTPSTSPHGKGSGKTPRERSPSKSAAGMVRQDATFPCRALALHGPEVVMMTKHLNRDLIPPPPPSPAW